MKKKAVLVTTSHRGVFFGYEKGSLRGGVVTITNARNCLYWSRDVKGFLGLAVTGPSPSCRVGPCVATMTLTGVTSVSDVNADAEKRWNDAPWS